MPSAPRRRSACDVCHRMKVRCSGTSPCDTCVEAGRSCVYSITSRLGRPPGTKNKRSAPTPRRVSRPIAGITGRSTSIPCQPARMNTAVEETTTEALRITDFDVLNAASVASKDQLPQPRAAQAPFSQPGGAQESRSCARVSSPHEPRDCSCFEQNSKLLCMLKRAGLDKGPDSDPTKCGIMVKIQETLRTWNGLIECPSCAQDEDSDIVLLALMCGRELVTQVRAEPGFIYDDGPTPGSSPPLLLGGYEVRGAEKNILLHALRSITFKKLERAVLGLKEVLEKKKTLLRGAKPTIFTHHDASEDRGNSGVSSQSHNTSNDFTYMEKMLQAIADFLKTIQSAEPMA